MVEAAFDRPPMGGKSRSRRELSSDAVSSVFGVDIDMGAEVKKQTTRRRKK
jgi:hypothetical protein